MAHRSYDLVAGMYDKLAKTFIGKALRQAQVYFLNLIPEEANILIVGGGTGWILEEIANTRPQNLYIDYVDISSKMIAKAEQRAAGNNKVTFINLSIVDFTKDMKYDVIITPFVLDNFNESTMQKVFDILHPKLEYGGLWIYTDFQISNKQKWWQKPYLFIMYSFFRIACNIEATELPDVSLCFNKYHYQLVNNKIFLRHFITTSAFKK